MLKDKIKTREEIAKICEELRRNGKKIVTTNGAFDILHSGHLTSLEKAKSFGDVLIVGLNSDASVRKYKSELRPIINEENRAKMLAGLSVVDYVIIFDEDNPINLLSVIRPNVYVKSRKAYLGIEGPTVEKFGGKVELVEDVEGISTSEIIGKILRMRDEKKS